MTSVVFFGTPDAAVPSLRSLSSVHEIRTVVTQPDRARGRSGVPRPPPIKEAALDMGLTIRQPANKADLAAVLGGLESFELGVVVAYGRILSREVLETPSHGILNVHFSLLPRWRGAAPVARAVMAGDAMSGVTIIKLDEGLDTGPVLTAQALDIGAEETAGELTERLAAVGARLLASVIPEYLSGGVTPVLQTGEGATYANKIESSDRRLTGEMPANEFVDRIRGLSPTPGATLVIDGVHTKILRAAITPHNPGKGRWAGFDGHLVLGLSDGGVDVAEIHPPGKRPMSGPDWMRGRRTTSGVIDG